MSQSQFAIMVLLSILLPRIAVSQEARLVDVGGHRLEVVVKGAGEPVVILEAGLGAPQQRWAAIQDSVAKFSTVVSYSRAGLGASDPSPLPRTPLQMAQELHALLGALQVPGPYVVVGHSLGALTSRVFVRNYPSEVAGLVLVDATHERQYKEFSALSRSFWTDRLATLEALYVEGTGAHAEFLEFWAIMERGSLPEAYPLPDVPIVALTAMREDPTWVGGSPEAKRIWRELHDELLIGFSESTHITTASSGHNMYIDVPGLVASAIRDLVDDLRLP